MIGWTAASRELLNLHDTFWVLKWFLLKLIPWVVLLHRDGIHFTAKASEIVVKEILKVLREADWKPSLYWKSLPVEFPFDFDAPNSISLHDLELTRNNHFEPPHLVSLCEQELTRNEQLEPPHPVSLCDHELTGKEQLEPPQPTARL